MHSTPAKAVGPLSQESPLSRTTTTTHTVDMAQIADLNHRLSNSQKGSTVTASDIGLEGATVTEHPPGSLAGSALLVRLCWDGAPEFPYIHGHFSNSAGSDGALVVDLHTAALKKLSQLLHAHHTWGQGSRLLGPSDVVDSTRH